jgi:S-adenosylmethionine synthetase
MAKRQYCFTSESVGEGHPDKVADQISDGILDALLKQDPNSRVACETLVKNNIVVLAGEITSKATADYKNITREIIGQIGYTDPKLGFDNKTCEIHQFVYEQSPDISMGVTEGEGTFKEQGAGDQGLMFGFACKETKELMPLPIMLSHRTMEELSKIRHNNVVNFLRPDAKAQVSVIYEDHTPVAVDTIVVSTQHSEEVPNEEIEKLIKEKVVPAVFPSDLISKNTRYFINPTGRFVIGGPVGDAGLTGRKIIVDSYGGYSRHGGGAFSGKDPSKVDRSAAYMARYIAKNVVAADLAERCEVQLAYAIGVAEPVSVLVETFGTAKVPEEKISNAVREVFRLTPKGIIESLKLLKPIYQATAAYGHFGRQPSDMGHFSWEKTDKASDLASLF